MIYRVVKAPLPSSAAQIEALINEAKPPGYLLITMTTSGNQLILVYGREA